MADLRVSLLTRHIGTGLAVAALATAAWPPGAAAAGSSPAT